MVRAIWNDTILAESGDTVVVEGNHYFPPESLKREHFTDSTTTSVCGWKGTAHYYHVTANNRENKNAAWYYPEPKSKAGNIRGYVAFWKGVAVSA